MSLIFASGFELQAPPAKEVRKSCTRREMVQRDVRGPGGTLVVGFQQFVPVGVSHALHRCIVSLPPMTTELLVWPGHIEQLSVNC